MGAVRNVYRIVVIILTQSFEDLHNTYLLKSESQVKVVKAKMFVFTILSPGKLNKLLSC
jgi:hypothetical protein